MYKTTANSKISRIFVHKYKSVMEVIETLRQNGGYITSSQAKGFGRGFYYKLLSAAADGHVDMIRRGVYALPERLANPMADIDALVPQGVLCMYSAWAHYELTDEIPNSFNVAIQKKRKLIVPAFPPVELYFWDGNQLNLGVTRKFIDGYEVNIYDMEKSVCDAVRFRNKIGTDVCAGIIREYLKKKESDTIRLLEYSKKLRVYTTIKNYLDIQIWQ